MAAERKPDSRIIAKALPGDELAPWEEQFARWMALQTTRVDKEDEQAAVRVLLGHDLSTHQLKIVKRKLAWKRVYQNERAALNETKLKQARHRAINLGNRALNTQKRVVGLLDREIVKAEADPSMDPLPIIRAAPALLNPAIDRAVPRRTEHTEQKTQITISLTPEQARGLTQPIAVIEAEEVRALTPEVPAA